MIGTSVWLIVVRGDGPRVVIGTSVWLIVVRVGWAQSCDWYKRVAYCGYGAWAQS